MYYVIFEIGYGYAKWVMDEDEFNRSFPAGTGEGYSCRKCETKQEAEELFDETNTKMRKYYSGV